MAKTKKKVASKTTKKAAAKSGAGSTKATIKAAAKTSAKAAKKTPAKSPKSSAKQAVPKKPAAAKKPAVTYKLREGDSVPPFSGASTSGRTINQDAHKTLVLYFYPKDNTPGCTLEGQDFRRLYKDFQKAGAEIVGVSQDSMSSHEKFKTKCDFPFDLLSDEDGRICKAFDVIQMKNLYGHKFEGIERSTFLIKNGVVKKEWRKVKVDGHAQAVLDAVKAL